jgi:hypothetical protein
MADLSSLSDEQLEVYKDLLTKKQATSSPPGVDKPNLPEGLKVDTPTGSEPFQNAPEQPYSFREFMTSPHGLIRSGLGQMGEGAAALTDKRYAPGIADMIEGFGKASLPAAAPLAVFNPGAATMLAGFGGVGDLLARGGADLLDANEEQQRAAGDVGSMLPLALGGFPKARAGMEGVVGGGIRGAAEGTRPLLSRFNVTRPLKMIPDLYDFGKGVVEGSKRGYDLTRSGKAPVTASPDIPVPKTNFQGPVQPPLVDLTKPMSPLRNVGPIQPPLAQGFNQPVTPPQYGRGGTPITPPVLKDLGTVNVPSAPEGLPTNRRYPVQPPYGQGVEPPESTSKPVKPPLKNKEESTSKPEDSDAVKMMLGKPEKPPISEYQIEKAKQEKRTPKVNTIARHVVDNDLDYDNMSIPAKKALYKELGYDTDVSLSTDSQVRSMVNKLKLQ